jgi:propionate CoA-transferase
MNLRNDMLTIPLGQRFTLDEQQNLFFVNLERFALRSLTERFYSGVSRYTTSGFLIKLGEALQKRGVAAHIFESAGEGQSDWRNIEEGAGLHPAPNKRAI